MGRRGLSLQTKAKATRRPRHCRGLFAVAAEKGRIGATQSHPFTQMPGVTATGTGSTATGAGDATGPVIAGAAAGT